MRALIVGSEGARGSIAAARALKASGWIVGVGAPAHGPVTASRAVFRTHQIPPPRDLKAFVKHVNAAIVAGGYEVVFGGGDAEVLALSAMRKSVRAKIPYPAHDRVIEALDKIQLMAAAEAAEVPLPRRVDTDEAALRGAAYPLIVKAGMHWRPERSEAPPRIEAKLAFESDEAIALVAKMQEMGAEVIVQELVEGDLLAFTALAGEGGKVLAAMQQRASHVWPPRSGVSVRATTEPVDEQLLSAVQRLLSRLEWLGIAQLQFMAGTEGPPRLIDLNGRFYGSLSLAVGAGCDLPSGWASLATGRPVEIQDGIPQVRYQWFEGDIRRALRERRGGKLADIRSCFAYARGAVHSVWSLRDPGPALSYIGTLSSRASRKLLP